MKLAMKPTEFREITQNNGHYVIQGHSRSPILVPIESTEMGNRVWVQFPVPDTYFGM